MNETRATDKHTPGPWPLRPPVDPEDSWWIQLDAPSFDVIASVFGPDNAEANARLIAAAPELLEALQGLTSLIESGVLVMREGVAAGAHDWAVGVGFKADAAIARATGAVPS